jgi:hypothetical protein
MCSLVLRLRHECFGDDMAGKVFPTDEVSNISKKLASFVTEELVANVKARYGDIGDDLLAFAAALEIGLPALTTLQVAQAAAKKKECDDLREIIRQQKRRLREYAEKIVSNDEVLESTRIDDSSGLRVNGGLGDETIANLEIFSDDD